MIHSYVTINFLPLITETTQIAITHSSNVTMTAIVTTAPMRMPAAVVVEVVPQRVIMASSTVTLLIFVYLLPGNVMERQTVMTELMNTAAAHVNN